MKKKETEVAIAETKGLPSSQQLEVMLKEETKRQAVISRFIQENLKEKQDYGVIPNTGSKPTLFKSGAEKVVSLFNVRAEFSKDTDTVEMLGVEGTVAFRCLLISRASGEIIGEGRGVAMRGEKSSWTLNTQVKIAEKRALVDAVLITFGLSSRYTQDIEDGIATNGKSWSEARMITEKQINYILKMADQIGMTADSLERQIKKPLDKLTADGASKVIEQLKGLLDEMEPPAVDADTGEIVVSVDSVDSEAKEGEVVDYKEKMNNLKNNK